MKEITKLIMTATIDGKEQTGAISDGYHTFDELYDHRITLFIALCKFIDSVDMKRSKCCGAEVKVHNADEDTSFYVCTECSEACDLSHKVECCEWCKLGLHTDCTTCHCGQNCSPQPKSAKSEEKCPIHDLKLRRGLCKCAHGPTPSKDNSWEQKLRQGWADYLETDSGKYTTIDYFVEYFRKVIEQARVESVEGCEKIIEQELEKSNDEGDVSFDNIFRRLQSLTKK